MTYFTELEERILKFEWSDKRPWIDKPILRKKNKAGRTTLPDFKLNYKAIVVKRVCCWHRNGRTDQWSRTESLEILPFIYGLQGDPTRPF